MGLFGRRKGNASAAPAVPLVDDALPDGQWLAASEQAFKQTIERFYGIPETMADGGHQRVAAGDAGVALCFFRKSIDMLHTAYGFNAMQSRQPSATDKPILDGFCGALETTIAAHPSAPTSEAVREVTHRLRSIATMCDSAGRDSRLYRDALDRIAALTPDVPTDDVLWN